MLKKIEGTAFTIMDVYLKKVLNDELDESDIDVVEQITILPEVIVEFVCADLDNDIYEQIKMNDKQLEAGKLFIKGIIEKDRTNSVGDVFALVGSYINPIGSAVRREMRAMLNDDPIYIELRNLYSGFGLDLILGVFDELIKRGEKPEKILSLLEEFATEVGILEEVLETRDYNIEQGIASGNNQKKEAKVAEFTVGAGGAIVGAKVGAVIGSIVPGFGTIVGAAVGGTIGNALAKEQGNRLGQDHEETVARVIDEAKVAKEKLLSWFK